MHFLYNLPINTIKMKEIIEFIRQNELHNLRDIILYKMRRDTTIAEGNVAINVKFYEDGVLNCITLSNNKHITTFRSSAEYNFFLFNGKVFESKGKYLLRKYIEQHRIKNIPEFIEKYSKNRKITLYFSNKLEFMIQLSFGKDFLVTKALFLDSIGKEYTELNSEEFYNIINELHINR